MLPGVEAMASSRSLPPHAVRVPTYVELEQYVRAFAAGHLNLLMLFGPPGVGKSRCVRQALDRHSGWISGQATPLGIYLEAYRDSDLAASGSSSAFRHQEPGGARR